MNVEANTIPPQPEPKDLDIEMTLRMTPREAQALKTLLRSIGGSPGGPRGMFLKIREELDELGVKHAVRGISGDVRFPDSWWEFEQGVGEED